MPSKNYIVRIYRVIDDKPKAIVGVVEKVGVTGKQAFTDLDELWNILQSEEWTYVSDNSDHLTEGDLQRGEGSIDACL